PPVAFTRNGVLAGIEPDLARELERRTGRRFQLVEQDWDALIPALESGRIDVIMAGMSITPERSGRVAFTDPYMRVGQMALIREADAARLAKPESLKSPGTRVGVVGGTTGDAFASSQLLRAIIFRYQDTEEGVRALQSGQVDYFIHDAPTVWHFSAAPESRRRGLMGLFTPLTEEHLAWAVRKEDDTLRRQLNAALREMRADGTLQAIVGRWIRTSVEVAPPR
ncbi:MAG TPA: transporter substrate-binding domain-containing protein, partial [Pelomicrobium sp.]|nr:transporter substrate-binding domain-containing protein [Pelomicrobium sp.]